VTTSSEASSSAGNRGVRLAELLATVSLASDLAHDVPAESALRDALFSVRLAGLAGWSRNLVRVALTYQQIGGITAVNTWAGATLFASSTTWCRSSPVERSTERLMLPQTLRA
jgi:hypothetical protein